MASEVRLIDANALRKKSHWMEMPDNQGIFFGIQAVSVSSIDLAPTIDLEDLRPKGRWEEYHTSRYGAPAFTCSCCYDIWESVQIKNMHYCPSCGAKMEG